MLLLIASQYQYMRDLPHPCPSVVISAVAEIMAAAGHAGASRWFHYGLTSNDVVDTAQALQIGQASALIAQALEGLAETLKRRAFEFKHAVQIGRTHGVHAEPTTFGLKFALWYAEVGRQLQVLDLAGGMVACGKISGAVGTFAHLEPAVEEEVCRDLGIAFAPVSTQVLQRDRHAHYLCALAALGGTLEKIATEIRHLQRTEVREAEEPFRAGQKGSSAMPHKRNPVKCEQVCGLARVLRANALVGLENQALWHERDISHSSAERVVLPDSTTLAHYMLRSLNNIVKNLHVYPDRMLHNLGLTHGLIYSGALLLALAEKGVLRETAYAWVQRNAMKAWEEGVEFRELVQADPDIRANLSEAEIAQLFNLEHPFRHVDAIFQRVFAAPLE
jgi:adenylosuccinate lyase